jgi:hypothetical protein
MRNLVIIAVVFSAIAARSAEPAAGRAEYDRLQAKFSELRSQLESDPQIVLHVRMIRLRLDALRKQGVDIRRGALALPQPAVPGALRADGEQHVDAARLKFGDPFLVRLETWLADPSGIAKSLGDARLLPQSGKPTSMKSGSELALALPQSLGGVTVEYVHYGINFKATPRWQDDGRLRLEIASRSSEILDARSTSLDGQAVPSLRVAAADFSVDLDPDEVAAVSGLVQTVKSESDAVEVETLTLVSTDLVGTDADRERIEALKAVRHKLAQLRVGIAVPEVAVRTRFFQLEAGTIERLRSEVERTDAESGASDKAAAAALADRFQAWVGAPDGPVTTEVDTTMVVPSGQSCFVHSGGELPVLVPRELGRVTLEYRRYGGQIDVTPELRDDGIVRLDIRPRIARRDPARDLTVNGHRIPSIAAYDFVLTRNMAPGKALLMSGLPQGFARLKPDAERPVESDRPAAPREIAMLISVEQVAAARELIQTAADNSLGRANP